MAEPAGEMSGSSPSAAAAGSPETARRWGAAWKPLKIFLRVALLAGVVWLVWHELTQVDLRSAREQLLGANTSLILLAIGAACVSIAVVGLYDVVAFPSTGRLTRRSRWGLGMLIFARTNFLTLGPIGGPALRIYLYRKRGLDPGQVVRGLLRTYAGMIGGLCAWIMAAIAPIGEGESGLAARFVLVLLLSPAIAVLAGHVIQRVRPVGPFVPRPSVYIALGLIGALDWTLALAVFVFAGRAVGETLGVVDHLRVVFSGQVVGYASMMPGGLGSADAVWLKLLAADGINESTAAAHIVLFRLVFYIMPWLASLLGLYIYFSGRAEALMRWQRRVLAGAIGLNAAWLLASTATPGLRERLRVLNKLVPVDAVEVSHAVAAVAAVLMLFLIRGLLRGYRGAFIFTGTLLLTSAIAHTFKGGDVEEALVSLVMLVLLLGARRAFRRRGRVPVGWELTAAAALGSLAFFVLVGITAYHDVEYTHTLWTRFAGIGRRAEAGRFLRGAALIAFVGLVFIVRQAMMPRRVREFASAEEVDRAVRFIATHGERAAGLNLAAGDKDVWFWHPGGDPGKPEQGVAVYQQRHGKMVVFSDPAVEERRIDEFLDDLHAFAADQDRELVFYQITGRFMQHLHDFGYTFFKLGEEAVVPVAEFSLQGGQAHQYRKTLRRVEGEGVTFQVLYPPFAAEVIEEARAVSDEWLRAKGIQEMQFSLGYFSPAYLQRFPMAVGRDAGGRMVAFMNVLAARPAGEMQSAKRRTQSANQEAGEQRVVAYGEVTFDLMRYRGGIDSLMDLMILRCLEWAHAQGYEFVNLGMSPLYDVGEYKRASIPERLARLLFEHGERIYNYRGVHTFKDKFRPVWEPRFMAYQRPWDWPAAVLAATSLIWGKAPADRRRIVAARVQASGA
jgi:phosphatidylglycerol lysyltransferase